MDETFDQWFLLGPEQLELRQVPTPRPGPGEIVLQLTAATTCGTDVKVYRRGGHARMLKPPCPFGHEVVGVLERSGPAFGDRIAVGERVVVSRLPVAIAGMRVTVQQLERLAAGGLQ